MCDIFGQSGGISFFIAKEGIQSICITVLPKLKKDMRNRGKIVQAKL